MYTSPKTVTPVVIIEQITSTKILIPYLPIFTTDMNYYTILHRVKDEKEDNAGTVIKDCIDSLGQLLTTDYDLPKVEYWVKIEDDAVICLNLFRYDMGVEKFNG